jgi:hypothetical protein
VTGQPRPNYRLARPLFIREVSVSFAHTHLTSSATMKKCASLGGTATATKDDVKEGAWSVSWYFLVKWCATLLSEGVEEDLLFGLWSIYIEEVFARFSPPRGFPRIICVSLLFL